MGIDDKVLESQLAGSWYDADPIILDTKLDGYLSNVLQTPGRDIIALIVPHAGYQYSGDVAAHGFKQIEGKMFDRVIVIGPSHQVPLTNAASIPNATHIETVFGRMELDRKLIYKLWNLPEFKSIKDAHEGEHSVDIALPFLQHLLGTFQLVPIVAGHLGSESTRRIAQALLDNIDSRTLVVISSDFTHYGEAFNYVPFSDDIIDNLESLDMGAFEFIKEKDRLGFGRYVADTGATICGQSPISILLAMLPDSAEVKLCKYDTSGKITGDLSRSVSYLSAAFSGTWEKKVVPAEDANAPNAMAFSNLLTDGVKKTLLRLARKSLTHYLKTWERATPESLNIPIAPSMKTVAGVFVTLYKRGDLRGCIGEVHPERELYEAVIERAIDAGLRDPRFARVTEKELRELIFEISVLSKPHAISSYEEIEIGQHGVMLTKGRRSAVFLPQVAVEHGWDRDQMLSQLCMKAGLCSDDWKEGCTFEVFEAIIFKDETIASPVVQDAKDALLEQPETESDQAPPDPQ